jgi:hypothetical protein
MASGDSRKYASMNGRADGVDGFPFLLRNETTRKPRSQTIGRRKPVSGLLDVRDLDSWPLPFSAWPKDDETMAFALQHDLSELSYTKCVGRKCESDTHRRENFENKTEARLLGHVQHDFAQCRCECFTDCGLSNW